MSDDNHNHDHDNGSLLAAIQAKFDSEDFLEAYNLDLPAPDLDEIEVLVEQFLRAVGEDPSREGLQKTPHRVASAYAELLEGYRIDPAKLINEAIFDVEYDDMVVVRDIEYASLCEHHLLPFLGRAHIAYIPDGKVIGLSKIPRIVDMFSKRLQVQERLTRQIADFIDDVIQPKGVAVVMDGIHMCSMIRGVKKHHSGMSTSAMLGCFRHNTITRGEFMSHISRTSGHPMF